MHSTSHLRPEKRSHRVVRLLLAGCHGGSRAAALTLLAIASLAGAAGAHPLGLEAASLKVAEGTPGQAAGCLCDSGVRRDETEAGQDPFVTQTLALLKHTSADERRKGGGIRFALITLLLAHGSAVTGEIFEKFLSQSDPSNIEDVARGLEEYRPAWAEVALSRRLGDRRWLGRGSSGRACDIAAETLQRIRPDLSFVRGATITERDRQIGQMRFVLQGCAIGRNATRVVER